MHANRIVLLSGGLDSMVLAHSLVKDGHRPRFLYFDCDKGPTMMETISVKKTSLRLGLPLEFVDLSGIVKMQLGYAPIDDVLGGELDSGSDQPIISFHIVVATALHYADLTDIHTIDIAIIQEQTSARPRLREFFDQFPRVVGLMALNRPGRPFPDIKIETPFARMSKAEVIKLGVRLGVPIEESWTCHFGGPIHCGACLGCEERRKGFADAGENDPTAYAYTKNM